ncbi:MAG: hypothetical protein ABFR82_13895 [Nitrospirota bacterium]
MNNPKNADIIHNLKIYLSERQATINPDTRSGLPGMTSGYVDRDWTKHHYTRWYREHCESGPNEQENINPPIEENPYLPEQPDSSVSHSAAPVGESSDLEKKDTVSV